MCAVIYWSALLCVCTSVCVRLFSFESLSVPRICAEIGLCVKRRLYPVLLRRSVGTPFMSVTEVISGVHSITNVWLFVCTCV